MAPRQTQPLTRAEFVAASRETRKRLHLVLSQVDGRPVRVRARLQSILRLHERLLAREDADDTQAGE